MAFGDMAWSNYGGAGVMMELNDLESLFQH